MKRIALLPTKVIERLRSGFCLSTTPQCVEELVLNAIDAGATHISVQIDFDLFRIHVVDNGNGISEDDLILIGSRYATSKCHSLEELNSKLHYYGFRGEALASIIEISGIVDITSKAKGSNKTLNKLFTYGKKSSLQTCLEERISCGSTITIQDFMFNLPIRRKIIKESIDLENIRNSLEALALIHHHISFSLRNEKNKVKILQIHKNESTLDRFGQLFGPSHIPHLAEIVNSYKQYKISGYISTQCFSSKARQFIYINKRLLRKTKLHLFFNELMNRTSIIRNRELPISHFFSLTNPNTSPPKCFNSYAVFFINIDCPLDLYDICLEPQKCLIEFKDWDAVLTCIEETIIKFAKEENVTISLDERFRKSFDDSWEIESPIQNSLPGALQIFSRESNKNKFEPSGKKFNQTPILESTPSRSPNKRYKFDDNPIDVSPSTLESSNVEKSCAPQIPFKKNVYTSSISDLRLIGSEIPDSENPVNSSSSISDNDSQTVQSISSKTISDNTILVKNLSNQWKQSRAKKDRSCMLQSFKKNNKSYKIEKSQIIYKTNPTPTKDNSKYKQSVQPDDSFNFNPVFSETGQTSTNSDVSIQKNLINEKYLRTQHNIIDNSVSEAVISDLFAIEDYDKFLPQELFEPSSVEVQQPSLIPSDSELDHRVLSTPDLVMTQNLEDIFCQNTLNSFPQTVNSSISSTSHLTCGKDNYIYIHARTEEDNFDSNNLSNPLVSNSISTTSQAPLMNEENSKNEKVHSQIIDCSSHEVSITKNQIHLTECKDSNGSNNDKLNSFAGRLKELRKINQITYHGNAIHVEPNSQTSGIESQNSNTEGENDLPLADTKADGNKLLDFDKFSKENTEVVKEVKVSASNWKKVDIPGKRPLYLNLHSGNTTYEPPPLAESPPLQQDANQGLNLPSSNKNLQKDKIRRSFLDDLDSEFILRDSKKTCFSMNAQILNSHLEGCRSETKHNLINSYNIIQPYKFEKEMLLSCKVLGQIDKKFIAVIMKSNSEEEKDILNLVVLIDQHAADERIQLEKIIEVNFKSQNDGDSSRPQLKSIDLSMPLKMQLPHETVRLMNDFRSSFLSVGLSFTLVNEEQVLFHTLPFCLFPQDDSDKRTRRCKTAAFVIEATVKEICEKILIYGGTSQNERYQSEDSFGTLPSTLVYILNTIACRSAIKFGKDLSLEECIGLIESLKKCKLPFQCAHGRPSLTPLVDINYLNSKQKKNYPRLKKLKYSTL